VLIEDVGRAELQIVDSNHKIHSILKALYTAQSTERLAHLATLGDAQTGD